MTWLLRGVVMCVCGLTLPMLGHAQAAGDAAEIVLVGADDADAQLQAVVSELLSREGVTAVFQHAERFVPEALLAAPDTDRRVRVFITLPSPELARLYLRGPYGRRFLLRDLTLRNGVDELGRESIAHVVATSTHALLHSTAGIDRDAVRADLDRQGVATDSNGEALLPPQDQEVPIGVDAPGTTIGFSLGLRDIVRWSGSELGARWGAGVELGISEQASPAWLFRQRLVFEHAVSQSLQVPELLSYVRGSALRVGQDVALVSGAHRAVFGLLAGVDILRITPQRAGDPSWSLSGPYTEVVPTLRAELRYELLFRWLFAALSVSGDVALRSVRFRVRDGATERTVAQAAWLSPGLALTLGVRTSD